MSVVNDTPYEAAEILRSAKPNFHPRIALILGSGLG
ncbi:purine-nucleoside phosphorylase, partial [Citrobacter youngae]